MAAPEITSAEQVAEAIDDLCTDLSEVAEAAIDEDVDTDELIANLEGSIEVLQTILAFYKKEAI
jgi:uncharacterized protein YgfB (UPF0149 family)